MTVFCKYKPHVLKRITFISIFYLHECRVSQNTLHRVKRSEIPSGMCAKLRTVVASNNRDHAPQSFFAYACRYVQSFTSQYRQSFHVAISLTVACSCYAYIGVILHAQPVRGESHNQRNATGEVATTSPPFYNESHRSHVLCVKAERGTTSTSWSQHHFVAIVNPERHVRKASHRGSKQQ